MTGKDVRNGSLAGEELQTGSVGTGQLSAAVNAALAPAPQHAVRLDVTVPDRGLDTHQAIGQVAGLDLDLTCGVPPQGQSAVGARLWAAANAVTFVDEHSFTTTSPPDQARKTTTQSTGQDGRVLVFQTSRVADDSVRAFGTFALTGAGPTRTGQLVLTYDWPTRTCHAEGWLLHG